MALRARRVRATLGLAPPRLRSFAGPAAALALVPALVAVAAAQPVISRESTVKQRLGSQAFFVLDTSGSMLAGKPTRLARAQRLAVELRNRLAGIPIGLASLTDRLLPHLMPTADARVFDATLSQSIGVNRPPPSAPYGGRATGYDAIAAVTKAAFFPPDAHRRLLVVFTDGESRPVRGSTLAAALAGSPIPIRILLVHVWRPREKIIVAGGKADPYYHADASSGSFLRDLAAPLGGTVLDETEPGAITAAARRALGSGGAQATAVEERRRIALAPWFVLAAGLPVAFLLVTRNVG